MYSSMFQWTFSNRESSSRCSADSLQVSRLERAASIVCDMHHIQSCLLLPDTLVIWLYLRLLECEGKGEWEEGVGYFTGRLILTKVVQILCSHLFKKATQYLRSRLEHNWFLFNLFIHVGINLDNGMNNLLTVHK